MSFTLAIIVGTLYFTYKPLFKYIKISKLSFAKIKELVKDESVRMEFMEFSIAQMQKIYHFIDSILKKKQAAQETQDNTETEVKKSQEQKKSE